MEPAGAARSLSLPHPFPPLLPPLQGTTSPVPLRLGTLQITLRLGTVASWAASEADTQNALGGDGRRQQGQGSRAGNARVERQTPTGHTDTFMAHVRPGKGKQKSLGGLRGQGAGLQRESQGHTSALVWRYPSYGPAEVTLRSQ